MLSVLPCYRWMELLEEAVRQATRHPTAAPTPARPPAPSTQEPAQQSPPPSRCAASTGPAAPDPSAVPLALCFVLHPWGHSTPSPDSALPQIPAGCRGSVGVSGIRGQLPLLSGLLATSGPSRLFLGTSPSAAATWRPEVGGQAGAALSPWGCFCPPAGWGWMTQTRMCSPKSRSPRGSLQGSS